MTKANVRNPFGLTHRQCEVMESLVRHGEPKLVAKELDISVKTVDWYMAEILTRMRARNRIVAVLKWDRRVREEAEYHGARPVSSVFTMAQAAA